MGRKKTNGFPQILWKSVALGWLKRGSRPDSEAATDSGSRYFNGLLICSGSNYVPENGCDLLRGPGSGPGCRVDFLQGVIELLVVLGDNRFAQRRGGRRPAALWSSSRMSACPSTG